jgi:hypothetical protein
MNTPSITPAQILAIVSSVLGLLVTVGVLDDTISKAILGVAATVVPVALVMVDAAIRKARAENAEAILQAKAVDAAAKTVVVNVAPQGVPSTDPATA